MTREQLNSATDALLDDNAPAGSILPSGDAALRKQGYDYIDQEVAGVVQNNLMPTGTKAASVNAVLAGLESITDETQAQIDEAIIGIFSDAGNWDASGGMFPTTNQATGGPVEKGNVFNVSVAGTLGGVTYSQGDSFRALVDTPGQTAGNWAKFSYTPGQATETSLGTVKYATDADVASGTGNGVINPQQLQAKLDNLPVPEAQSQVYKATLAQTAGGGIVATVRTNTLGVTVDYTVQSTGVYGISPSDFGNYSCYISNMSGTKTVKATGYITGFSGQFKQFDLTGTPIANFNDVYIEIRPLNS